MGAKKKTKKQETLAEQNCFMFLHLSSSIMTRWMNLLPRHILHLPCAQTNMYNLQNSLSLREIPQVLHAFVIHVLEVLEDLWFPQVLRLQIFLFQYDHINMVFLGMMVLFTSWMFNVKEDLIWTFQALRSLGEDLMSKVAMVSLGIGQVKERIDYFFRKGDGTRMGLEEHGAGEALLVVDIYLGGVD